MVTMAFLKRSAMSVAIMRLMQPWGVVRLRPPADTDALVDTVDYSEIVTRIIEIGTQQSFQLIEALAEKIATVILEQFAVDEIHLVVKKLHPPIKQPIDYFAIEIFRNA